VLIIVESSIGAFLLMILLQFYPCYYLALSFYSCTCWVPTISVLNLDISPCRTKSLLRRWRWTGILRWGVRDYALPDCCSYGVLESSAIPFDMRVVLVFKDIIYIINILYSWHLVICDHFLCTCVEQLILGIHTMITWFCLQNQAWQSRLPGW
jgi:hypothetical protein